MKSPIGILGGMGAFAGLRLVQHAIQKAAENGAKSDSDYPKLLFYNLPIEGMDKYGVTDRKVVFSQLRGAIDHMTAFGCNPIVIACNSVHSFHSRLQGTTNSTLLNIVEIGVSASLEHSPVGIMCSRTSKKDGLYDGIPVGKRIHTEETDQVAIDHVIENVIEGHTHNGCSASLKSVADNLISKGAKSILLGCTELGCAFDPLYIDIPVFDSGIVAVDTALNWNG